MANRRFYQFMYTAHPKPVLIDVDIPIGASGAVGTLTSGTGISAVTRISAGIYQVTFLDNYNSFIGVEVDIWSPNSGSNILVASAGTTSGTAYIITTVGTTTTAGWQTLGLPIGIAPAVGVVFKATATTTATGTGAVQIPAAAGSGLNHVEPIGNPSLTMYPTGLNSGLPYMMFQCLAATNSSTTTLVATDPANGSTLSLAFYFDDSSLTKGY